MKFNSKRDKERYERTKKRAEAQDYWTSLTEYHLNESSPVTYSVTSDDVKDGFYHLLSEGVVVDGNGKPYQIIGNGELQKWYDALDPETTYDIDLDHQMNSALFRQIGTWKKSDLRLEDGANGRKALYAKPRLDEDSVFVKELRRLGTPFALSVEFWANSEVVEITDDRTGEVYSVLLHKDLNIDAFSVVSEPQDAKSGNLDFSAQQEESEGYSLNEEEKTGFLNKLKGMFSLDEEVKDETVEETEVVEDEVVEEEVKEDEVQEETETEVEEEVKEDEEVEEEAEVVEDEKAPEQLGLTAEEFLEAMKPMQEAVIAMNAKMDALESRVEQLNSFKVSDNAKIQTYSKRDRVGF